MPPVAALLRAAAAAVLPADAAAAPTAAVALVPPVAALLRAAAAAVLPAAAAEGAVDDGRNAFSGLVDHIHASPENDDRNFARVEAG